MLTSHELFGFMSPALAAEIVEFAHESDKPLYKATLAAVAEMRKVRPVFLERQPRPQRNAALLARPAQPVLEPAAGNLIRGCLVNRQRGLLAHFLDVLEFKHEKGV